MINMVLRTLLQVVIIAHNILVAGQTSLTCEPSDSNRQSCNCIVKGISTFPTAIHLCSLADKEFYFVLANYKTKHDGTRMQRPQQMKSSSIDVLRYLILNAFQRIKSYPKALIENITTGNPCRHQSLTPTNCPSYSMCCFVSCVSSECDDENSADAACIAPRLNADAYGHYGKWHIKQDDSNFPGSVAVIQINAGPCYYCNIHSDGRVRDLYTLIGLYCDERVLDQGHPVLVDHPSDQNPRLLFHWNTSQACYEFNTNEECSNGLNICSEDKTFSCSSRLYHFSFPFFANQSITTRNKDENVEYTFGFCANDIDCSSTGTADENTDVMICRKMDNQATPVAYYNDNIEVKIRPTGFVWRIRNYFDNTLKAVISFQCSDQSSEKIDFNVIEKPKLPVLLILKHKCFCPNPQSVCKALKPHTQPIYHPTTTPPGSDGVLKIWLPVVIVIVLFMVFLFLYKRQYQPNPGPGPDPGQDPGSGSGSGPPSRQSSNSSRSSSYHTPPSSMSTSDSRNQDTAFNLTSHGLQELDSNEKTPLLCKKYNKHKKHSTV